MAEAQYYHCDVYRFLPGAYNEIIRRFNTAMQDVAARCWYDTQRDVFDLKSPAAIGQKAIASLIDVEIGFIADELAAAERENRAPLIQLFTDGVLEDDTYQELGNDHPNSAMPTPTPLLTQENDTAPNFITHSLNLEQSANSRIKAFRLAELPDGLVDRILCPGDAISKKVMAGVTYRTVRWDQTSEIYTFNGRLGSAIYADSPNAQLLYSTRFNSVSGPRAFEDHIFQVKNLPTQKWEFAPNESAPGVSGYLEGMGKTVLVDPDTMSEVPEDAARFLSQPTHPHLPQGRRRVPAQTIAARSGETSSSSSDNDSDDDASARSSTNSDVKRKNNYAQGTNASRVFGLPMNAGQDSLLKETNHPPRPIHGSDQVRTPKTSTPSASGVVTLSSFNSKNGGRVFNTVRSSSDKDTSTSGGIDIPTYNRPYAAVDSIGLTGIPMNQATWAHENPSPKKSKANKSGISLREASTHSQSGTPLPSAVSTATSSVPARAFPGGHGSSGKSSAYSSTNLGLQHSAQSSPQEWSRKNMLPKSSDLKLIDDSAVTQTKSFTKPPPGLDYMKNRCELSTTVNSTQLNGRTASGDLLVDVSENDNETEHFSKMISCLRIQGQDHSKEVAPTKETSAHRSLDPNNSNYAKTNTGGLEQRKNDFERNGIVERLQATPDDLKRFTMNQKAEKPKGRKLSKNPVVTNVILPKPDPIQPVQSNVNAKKASAGKDAAQHPKLPQAFSNPLRSSSADNMQQAKNRSPPPPTTAVQELVSRVITGSACVVKEAAVYVRFGMILLQEDQVNNTQQKGATTKEILQAKLRSSETSTHTTFFPRLTTSTSDALFLLDLVQGSALSAVTQYEIVVKNAEGAVGIIKMEEANKDSVQVFFPSVQVGTCYIHYPIRVWDAKAAVETVKTDKTMDSIANEVVSSMQTIDEAPSFVATIPSGAFSIERVYAKRIFFKTISDRIEIFATEVQDLAPESLNDPCYNFKAAVFPREEMVDKQRLWWELELRADVVDDETAARLQGLTDLIVSEMDGVGYANKGPWEKAGVKETQDAMEIPFW